jgi:hypothetical protein
MEVITHARVAHVGTMDAALKNHGSQEGACLSVSLHPIAWAHIHRLGDNGFILDGPGRFLDAFSLTEEEQANLWQWAKDEALVEDTVVWTVSYEDDELEDTISFECATEDEALAEADEIFDAVIESRPSTAATRRLAELCHQDPERMGPQHVPSDFQFDLILSLWTQSHLDVDGVWWNEKLDPAAYSAPRGLIFPSRISSWTAVPAGLRDLEDFENDEHDVTLARFG